MTTMHLRSLAAVLLASMPSSLLLAQDAAPRPPEAGSRAESRTEVRIERGGSSDGARSSSSTRSVEFDMQNGRPSRIVIDGKEISLDRLRETPDGYEVLDADGKVIERIKARRGRGAFGSARAGGSRMGRASAEAGGEQGLVIVEGQPLDAQAMRQEKMRRDATMRHQVDTDAPAPKSMIGVGLGGVSEAIAHHLGLDAERAAKATMLTGVVKDLPAAAAGLERFDVIVSVNGADDASRAALGEVLRSAEPGSKITLGVRRGGETRSLEVTVVAFDRAKLEAMEPIMVDGFDLGALEGLDMDVGGMDMLDMGMPDMDLDAAMDAAAASGGVVIPPRRTPRGAMAGENMVAETMDSEGNGWSRGFFIGPDGERREFRMGVPAMPRSAPRGADAAQIDALRDLMREFERRMEAMNERLQGGPRPGDRPDAPRAPGEEGRRDEIRRDAPRGDAETNERLRRLEERLDAVMRELERANAERRGR